MYQRVAQAMLDAVEALSELASVTKEELPKIKADLDDTAENLAELVALERLLIPCTNSAPRQRSNAIPGKLPRPANPSTQLNQTSPQSLPASPSASSSGQRKRSSKEKVATALRSIFSPPPATLATASRNSAEADDPPLRSLEGGRSRKSSKTATTELSEAESGRSSRPTSPRSLARALSFRPNASSSSTATNKGDESKSPRGKKRSSNA